MTCLICESYLRFQLPEGSRRHESINPSDTGVDIEMATEPPVWLEVKNWDSPVIPLELRPKSDDDFLAKTKAVSEFWVQIIRKFEGTYDILDRHGQLPSEFQLTALLQSHLFEAMPLASVLSTLESLVARSIKLRGRSVGVVDVREFTQQFSDCSVTPCDVTPHPECLCGAPVEGCSAKRRHHE